MTEQSKPSKPRKLSVVPAPAPAPRPIHSLADLTPDTNNARRHNPRNIGMIADSLQEVGAARSIVVDEQGQILAGNGTVEAAIQAGMTGVQVVDATGEELVVVRRSGLTPEQKIRLALADNRSAETADWNTDVLAQLQADTPDLLAGLWREDELADLLAQVVAPPTPGSGGDDFDATPAEGPTRVQPGDVWAIGPHRLVCGDSTRADQVASLFEDARAEMVWTDPPYGVGIGDKNKFLNTIAPSNRIEENLQNDNLSEPDLTTMLRDAFTLAVAYGLAGGAWYVAAPPVQLHLLFGQVLKDLGIWHQTITWVKNNATFAPLGVDYHWRAEPIFYGWQPGAAHRYYGGRKQDTVWEIDRPQKSPEHPTMKPVELVTRAIENSSLPTQIVYDPFLGSGTTLIAAHRTGRVCYGVELEPRYCDVILRRAEAEGIGPIARLDI